MLNDISTFIVDAAIDASYTNFKISKSPDQLRVTFGTLRERKVINYVLQCPRTHTYAVVLVGLWLNWHKVICNTVKE